MNITIFSEELRKCLNAAGLSDCGENDTWNYWYQRLMNAYNESVERQIMTEQAENAKLRELAAGIGHLLFPLDVDYCATCPRDDINHPCPVHTVKGGECLYETDLRDLGVEVNDV